MKGHTRAFHLKTYRLKHNYDISLKNKRVKSIIIAKMFGSTIKAMLEIKLRALKESVRKKINIAITTSWCRCAKLRVIQELMGSEVKEYTKLWDYTWELRTENPRSTVILNVYQDFNV